MTRYVALLAAALALTANEATAQTRVAVSVSATDSLRNQITSYITRELRTIPDIVIVEDKPEYEIQIVALNDALESGRKIGYSMSVVITYRVGDFFVKELAGTNNQTVKYAASMLAEDYVDVRTHRLLTGPNEGLQANCSKVVADFDASELEPTRKFIQKLRDAPSKAK